MDHVSEFEDNAPSLGIDLGLKSVVALSNGFKIATPKFYRQEEKQLGVFQRRPGRGGENRQQAFPPRDVARSRAALWGDLRRRREPEEAGQDTDGEVRPFGLLAGMDQQTEHVWELLALGNNAHHTACRNRLVRQHVAEHRPAGVCIGCAWSEAWRCDVRDVARSRHQRCSEYRNCRSGTSPLGSGNPRPSGRGGR
jgi:hypothetical protein